MTREEAIHKMKFSQKAYQNMIDEEVSKGIISGLGIKGEWESEEPLTEEYIDMRDACDMSARSLEAWDAVLADIREIENRPNYMSHSSHYWHGFYEVKAVIKKHMQEVEE